MAENDPLVSMETSPLSSIERINTLRPGGPLALEQTEHESLEYEL